MNQWTQILRTNFNNWKILADYLELDEEQRQYIDKKPNFILNIPLRLAQKCVKGRLDDPILRQFLPTIYEHAAETGFTADPTKEASFCKTPKLLHKYAGRVLLVCTSACAMNCRFCFRQNFDYQVQNKSFDQEIEIIKEDPTIHEVILSGGDPLSFNDGILGHLLMQIDQIPHIKRIRFHSRFPIGIPERIDDSFLSMLKSIRKQMWFILHVNHSKELDEEVLRAMEKLRKMGMIVMSQSVLLHGVNDNEEDLAELFLKLVDNGIVPYYLHQLDRVLGTVHFEVPEERGKALIGNLSKRLPGYALPKYVRETPGEPNKSLLS